MLIVGALTPRGKSLIIVVASGVAFGAKVWLSSLAKTQVGRVYYPLTQTIVDGNLVITSSHTGANSITLTGVGSVLTAGNFVFA